MTLSRNRAFQLARFNVSLFDDGSGLAVDRQTGGIHRLDWSLTSTDEVSVVGLECDTLELDARVLVADGIVEKTGADTRWKFAGEP